MERGRIRGRQRTIGVRVIARRTARIVDPEMQVIALRKVDQPVCSGR